MNGLIWQLSRERWKEILKTPYFWGLFWLISIILTIWFPFAPHTDLPLMSRLTITLGHCVVFWIFALLISVPIRIALRAYGFADPTSIGIAIGVTCLPLAAILYQLVADGSPLRDPLETTLLIAAIMFFNGFTLSRLSKMKIGQRLARAGLGPQAQRVEPGLVNARPQDLLTVKPNSQVHALLAKDHYVEVVTDHGIKLVHMRLADAISICSDIPGLRVHRSAWVAEHAVRGIVRDGRNMRLELSVDTHPISVSRNKQNDVLGVLGKRLSGDGKLVGLEGLEPPTKRL